MANNLRKFNTYSDYQSAELVKPAVSLIAAINEVYFDQKDAPVPPTPTFSGLTVYYNITDTSQPTVLFKGGGGSGSGSGSGSGGVLPSAMIIDGTAVEVTNTYQFSTTGEHIVNYSFADNTIPQMFLYDGEGIKFNTVTKIIIGDSITIISESKFGNGVFMQCRSLSSVTIGNGVTSIGSSAFQVCTGLTNIDIPSGVTSIGSSAFYDCTGLKSIVIPDGVTSIGELAFCSCSGLTSCTIGSGVTSIGSSAFQGCTSLTSITVDSSNTTYDSRNNCNALIETSTNTLVVGCKNTIIPSTVTSIGSSAFQACTGLTSIDIPSGVTSIGNVAFQFCSGLTSCTIGSGVTSIGNGTFSACYSLTNIDIPDSVTSIGGSAFNNCTSLTSIDIPNSVTTIGDWAFNFCSGFMSVVCRATTPPTLGNAAFNNTNNCPIYVPSASVDAYKAANKWSTYSSRIQGIS